MKTAELVKREHDAILESLAVLASMCKRLNLDIEIPAEDLAMIIDFTVSFTMNYHEAREESILFPAMEKAGITSPGSLHGSFTAQHHLQRADLRLMEDSVMHEPFHRDKFIRGAVDYVLKKRVHMEKEMREIYEVADAMMDQASVERLGRELGQYDATVTGASRVEELYRIPVLLKATYWE